MKISKSEFLIKKMDCPSEENIIRMKLDDISSIEKLAFDIPDRTLEIYHDGNLDLIKDRIVSLNFDSSLV